VALFVTPATIVLALKIHRQWALFRKNAVPILAGCIAGSVASLICVIGLSRWLGLPEDMAASLAPKSVTSAIAMELSQQSGGIPPLTISAVVLTGTLCAIAAPLLVRIFRLKDPVAIGAAMGASGHAVGTARALEMGETEGAVGGIALTLMGIITSLIYLLL
jgi:putative effector of murein hydrolase